MNQHRQEILPPGTPAEAPSWFEQMLEGFGFPAPQGVFQELHRLNDNLERFGPALSSLDTTQIQGLTNALVEASNIGKNLLAKLK